LADDASLIRPAHWPEAHIEAAQPWVTIALRGLYRGVKLSRNARADSTRCSRL